MRETRPSGSGEGAVQSRPYLIRNLASIPHIAFIILDTVLSQKFAVLLLE
jgi:hypothetical protein